MVPALVTGFLRQGLFRAQANDVEFVVGKVAREVSLLSVLHLPLSIQIPH